MSEGLHVFLAAEGPLDREVVVRLANTLIARAADWFDPETLARFWYGENPGQAWYPIKKASRDARDRGLVVHGAFGDEAESRMFRSAMLLAHACGCDAAVFERDDDKRSLARRGFEAAKEISSPSYPVVLACPVPEVEAWVIAGFEPSNADERARLDAQRQKLGFAPNLSPECLTSRSDGAPTDAKKVLAALTANDPDRLMACLDDVDRLRTRGNECGLCSFLDDVEKDLVPLFAGRT